MLNNVHILHFLMNIYDNKPCKTIFVQTSLLSPHLDPSMLPGLTLQHSMFHSAGQHSGKNGLNHIFYQEIENCAYNIDMRKQTTNRETDSNTKQRNLVIANPQLHIITKCQFRILQSSISSSYIHTKDEYVKRASIQYDNYFIEIREYECGAF